MVQREIAPLRDEDIPKFLEAIEDSPYRNSLAVCLLAGLREGELLGLPWYQVDFEKGRITVSQQLQREKKKNGANYIADTTKSGKPRTIEPPRSALNISVMKSAGRRKISSKPVSSGATPKISLLQMNSGRTSPFIPFTNISRKSLQASGVRTRVCMICDTRQPR